MAAIFTYPDDITLQNEDSLIGSDANTSSNVTSQYPLKNIKLFNGLWGTPVPLPADLEDVAVDTVTNGERRHVADGRRYKLDVDAISGDIPYTELGQGFWQLETDATIPEMIVSSSSTLIFDETQGYQHGTITSPITGDITLDATNVKRGTTNILIHRATSLTENLGSFSTAIHDKSYLTEDINIKVYTVLANGVIMITSLTDVDQFQTLSDSTTVVLDCFGGYNGKLISSQTAMTLSLTNKSEGKSGKIRIAKTSASNLVITLDAGDTVESSGIGIITLIGAANSVHYLNYTAFGAVAEWDLPKSSYTPA